VQQSTLFVTSLARASNGRLMSGLRLPADAAIASALFGLGKKRIRKGEPKEAFIAFGNSIARSIVTASAPFRNAGHRMELFPSMPWTR
jgi:hypothetical protein